MSLFFASDRFQSEGGNGMKKYGAVLAVAVLAAALATACGAKRAESAAASSSAASEAVSKSESGVTAGESVAATGEKKNADFKAEDFQAGAEITAQAEAAAQMLSEKHEKLVLADGSYQVNVTLSGGSGRAKIASPTELKVKDGRATAKLVWSSDKYDYMEVEGIRFTPEIQNGHAVFVIPVTELDKPLAMIGDTTAMSQPHAIDYQLTFELQE